MTVKCSECDCVMDFCKDVDLKHCMRCTKQTCCCVTIHKANKQNSILIFLHHTRTLFAAALGIEILCISAAEIGENSAFYFFGYHLQGIILGYIMGYAAAGFTTFMTMYWGGMILETQKLRVVVQYLSSNRIKDFSPILFTLKKGKHKEKDTIKTKLLGDGWVQTLQIIIFPLLILLCALSCPLR